MVLIAPSILAADFLHLEREIKAIEDASADLIHIDVMDGRFVPNLTMGPFIIKAIKKISSLPLDVHLMIEKPDRSLKEYCESGADFLTIHAESLVHLERSIKAIKAYGAKAGVALNPSTHESVLQYVIGDLDMILVMSVNPGFSGQSFLPAVVKKIVAIKNMLQTAGNKNCLLSVDGGINDTLAQTCVEAGASCLVAGSYIFNSTDYKKAIASLRPKLSF